MGELPFEQRKQVEKRSCIDAQTFTNDGNIMRRRTQSHEAEEKVLSMLVALTECANHSRTVKRAHATAQRFKAALILMLVLLALNTTDSCEMFVVRMLRDRPTPARGTGAPAGIGKMEGLMRAGRVIWWESDG